MRKTSPNINPIQGCTRTYKTLNTIINTTMNLLLNLLYLTSPLYSQWCEWHQYFFFKRNETPLLKLMECWQQILNCWHWYRHLSCKPNQVIFESNRKLNHTLMWRLAKSQIFISLDHIIILEIPNLSLREGTRDP